MKPRRIQQAFQPVRARLEAVPSKSATHRALVAAALADGRSLIENPLLADDTRTTLDGLRALGVDIEPEDGAWAVRGRPHGPSGGARVQLGESGTSFRFLAAVAALGQAPSTLEGGHRLSERPIAELSRALVTLGAEVRPPPGPANLPWTAGGRAPRGGRVRVPADKSSQFASALLLIGSRLAEGLDLELMPPVVSMPYVRLTVDVLRDFGVDVEECGAHRFKVRPTDYPGKRFTIEGDHSSASYLLAAPALVGGRVRVDGLLPGSSQPDARLGPILSRLACRVRSGPTWIEVEGDGRLPPFDLDLGSSPDLVPTLAVLSLAADGPCVLRGIAHLRLKESDRLEALALNLSALGRPAVAIDDRLQIGGPPGHGHGGDAGRTLRPIRPLRQAQGEQAQGGQPQDRTLRQAQGRTIRTFSDHRMAMAFALAGLRVPGISLDDSECIAKSNPDFWSQFEELTRAEREG